MYSEAFERKLKPIYDAIDGRSYKNALKHTDAALKKYPNHQLLRALRAFALQRTGRSEEALSCLQSIVDQVPENERVLHTMTFTYRAAGKSADIASAYAVAAEKYPQDLDILSGLFGAYAKDLNFVKQQQVALKLAKAHPPQADKFNWWAVASLALQARAAVLASPPGANAPQLMKLAETMAQRQVTRSKGVPSFEALLLYIDILAGQGKASEAAAIIRETKGNAAGLVADSRQLLAAALVRAGDLPAAAALYKEACLEDPNDWWSWQLYLNCVLPGSVHSTHELNTPGIVFPVGIVGGLAEEWDKKNLAGVWKSAAEKLAAESGGLEAAVAEATATLDALKAASLKEKNTAGEGGGNGNAGNGVKNIIKSKEAGGRGPILAPLELVCRLGRLGLASSLHLVEAVAAALPQLCHSFSCAVDLRRYLAQLGPSDGAEIEWLSGEVARICEEAASAAEQAADGGDKAAAKALWCRVNVHAVRRELGLPLPESATAAVEYASQLVSLFASNLRLSEGLDPKERGHGEDLVSLAASTLVAACKLSSKTNPQEASLLLLAAVFALEAAQVRRTVAAPLRLSACAIYTLLSAPKHAVAQLTALDVKSILHETMSGHWALPALLAGAASEADMQPWLAGITNIYQDQVPEASESMYTAYEQEMYSKIPEFVDFWETLGRSHSHWLADAEADVLKLRTAGTPAQLREAAEKLVESAMGRVLSAPLMDNLRFNEDLSTRPEWYAPSATDARFAVAQWWSGAGDNPAPPAASQLWWGVTGAAERDCEEAIQWRDAQRAALGRRRALPQLLAGVLKSTPLPSDENAQLQGLLDDTWAPQRCPTESSSIGLPCEIGKALFSAGLAVHAAAAALLQSSDPSSSSELVQSACKLVNEAAEKVVRVCEMISASFSSGNAGGVLLPLGNDVCIALSGPVICEEAAWTAACLSSWISLTKTTSSLSESLMHDAFAAAAAKVYAALTIVDAHLVAVRDAPAAPAAAHALHEMEEKWQVGRLWGYEKGFNASKVLQGVLEEQAAVAGRLHTSVAKSMSFLKPWALSKP